MNNHLNEDSEANRKLDAECINESQVKHAWWHGIKYVLTGALLGIIFVKAEIISWYRIQEMFRMQSFHMYGVIGSAVIVAAISIFIIKKFNIKTIYGEKIEFTPKPFQKGQIIGGLLFGLGWAITGACPGPLFTQIGTGSTVIIITLLTALFGTWFYGFIREKLPH